MTLLRYSFSILILVFLSSLYLQLPVHSSPVSFPLPLKLSTVSSGVSLKNLDLQYLRALIYDRFSSMQKKKKKKE